MGIEIDGCEDISNIGSRRKKRSQPVEHEPFDIARRDTHSSVCLRTIARQQRCGDVVAVSPASLRRTPERFFKPPRLNSALKASLPGRAFEAERQTHGNTREN